MNPCYRIFPVHGEGASVFHLCNVNAPASEQPAIVASFTDRKSADRCLHKMPNTTKPREWFLARYPRLCAHVIAESLGYATPSVAASIVQAVACRQQHWCEWIAACYGCKPEKAVRDAIRKRHAHKGYMAEYKRAFQLVGHAVNGNGEPELASWF